MSPKIIALLIAIICMPAAIALASPDISTEAASLIKQLKSDKQPVFPTDLNNYYPKVDDTENAAIRYLEAYDQFHRPSSNYKSSIPLFDPNSSVIYRVCDRLPEVIAASTEQFIHDNADAFSSIRAASKLRDSRYPITFTQQSVPMANHHIKIRTLANLIELRAILTAHHLQNDLFFENMLLYHDLIRSLDNEPLLTTHNLRLQLLTKFMQQVERAVIYQRLTEEQMQTLQYRLQSIDLLHTYRRMLIGERGLMLVVTKQIPIDFNASIAQLHSIQSNLPLYLRTMQQLIDLPAYPSIDDTTSQSLVKTLPSTAAEMREYLTDYTDALTRTRHLEAQRQVTIASLALQRHRYDHGDTFPSTLRDITPDYLAAVPRDPYLPTRPLKYRHDKNGAVIYSIGPDLTDNRGRELTSHDERTFGYLPTFTNLKINPNTPLPHDHPDLTDITISFLAYQKMHFNKRPTNHQPNPASSSDSPDDSSVLDSLMMDF